MIDIKGLERSEVLRVLYNNSRAQGMGALHFTPEPMTSEEAQALVAERDYFDYVHGRVMKVSLDPRDDELSEHLYDRDNGRGAAQRAIDGLREGN